MDKNCNCSHQLSLAETVDGFHLCFGALSRMNSEEGGWHQIMGFSRLHNKAQITRLREKGLYVF